MPTPAFRRRKPPLGSTSRLCAWMKCSLHNNELSRTSWMETTNTQERPIVLEVIAKGSPAPSHCLLGPRHALCLVKLPTEIRCHIHIFCWHHSILPCKCSGPLLFLQAVPSNPFLSADLSIPGNGSTVPEPRKKGNRTTLLSSFLPKIRVRLASPLQTLWPSLCSRAMAVGTAPASSFGQGLGWGFIFSVQEWVLCCYTR